MTITVGMTPNEIEESFNIFDFEDEDLCPMCGCSLKENCYCPECGEFVEPEEEDDFLSEEDEIMEELEEEEEELILLDKIKRYKEDDWGGW